MLSQLPGKLSLQTCLVAAIAVRAALVAYTVLCDQLGAARFTDVDYLVFSDAAALVWQGRSPYERATYRYTPLLAALLAPLLQLHSSAGKVLFCSADCMVAWCASELLHRLSHTAGCLTPCHAQAAGQHTAPAGCLPGAEAHRRAGLAGKPLRGGRLCARQRRLVERHAPAIGAALASAGCDRLSCVWLCFWCCAAICKVWLSVKHLANSVINLVRPG